MTVFVALGEVCEASQLILRYSGCFCVSHLQRDSLRLELLTLSHCHVHMCLLGNLLKCRFGFTGVG